MPRLIWTPAALEDVRRFYRLLAAKDADTARRAAKTIRTSLNLLERRPEIGRPAEDMEPEYREWLIDFGNSGYVALYRYEHDTGVILAIRHQKEAGH